MLIKTIGVIAAVLVIALIAVSAAMYFRFIPIPGPILALLVGAKPPEYSARYYPPNTLAYGWLTLVPGQGQLQDSENIWERFNEFSAFRDLMDLAKEEFEDETGIDFETGVMPWAGPELSVGLLNYDAATDIPTAVVLIGVRDQKAAADFMQKWAPYIEGAMDTSLETGSYQGFDTWVNEDNLQAYTLTGDWLVFATHKNALEDVIDRIAGNRDDSLYESENFTAARSALPERRFNSTYVNAQLSLEILEHMAIPELALMGAGSFDQQAPEWLAMSAGWVDRGIVVDMVSPTVRAFGFEVADLADPAPLLPDDTLGFIAATFDPDIDHWRTALSEYQLVDVLPDPELLAEVSAGLGQMGPGGERELAEDATLADVLDLGFGLAKDFTRIDLETELFNHLAGEVILAVSEFDFDTLGDDSENNPVDAVAMLAYREEGAEELRDTMDKVNELIAEYLGLFIQSDTADLGGDNDATVFRIDGTGYAPGYVMHDGYLTLGSREAALEAIVSRQNGTGATLSSDAEYVRALGHLPDSRQFLAYIDIPRIVRQTEPQDFDLEADQHRILAEGLGVLALAGANDADYGRAKLALMLFPE